MSEWITDRPPTVEEVDATDACLITLKHGELSAWVGEFIRRDWGHRVIAWQFPPDPYSHKPTYRPFASAEEFSPHRDRWVLDQLSRQHDILRVDRYNEDSSVWIGGMVYSWRYAFERFTFEDGTPFGVEVKR